MIRVALYDDEVPNALADDHGKWKLAKWGVATITCCE